MNETVKDQDKIEAAKLAYENVKTPEQISAIIENTFKKAHRKAARQPYIRSFQAVAALFMVFVLSINLNQSFAVAMGEIPILNQIVKVFSFRFDKIETEQVHASVEVPVITGLSNETLQAALNEKYLEENKKLYEAFKEEMKLIESIGGHLGVDSGYEVLTDTEQLLSIARYEVNTVASSSTTMKYDTIDKQEGILITLPSLFKDDSYIDVISKYLIEEMRALMKEDEMKVYWVLEDDFAPFEQIKPDQNFYITAENKLVMSFDKYEVAPGYMGIVTMEIPTDIIQDILVSDTYIK